MITRPARCNRPPIAADLQFAADERSFFFGAVSKERSSPPMPRSSDAIKRSALISAAQPQR
jgi:hypothetical protein